MSYLRQYGLKLIDNGYKLIPIKEREKKPVLNAWQNIDATQEMLEDWLTNGLSGSGAGVLTKYTPAVDIDVRDEKIVKEMVAFVEELLGKSLKRVGLPPKVLLPFRTDKPFKKISSGKYEDFLGHKHQVEILGDGQQFVAFAIHPQTQKPYTWENDQSLSNTRYEDLPLITQEKAQAIVDHFERIADREDWEKISDGERSREREPTTDAFENYKKPLDIPLKKIKESLNRLDPDEDRGQWIMVGMSLYHQFKGDVEGLSLWDKWSSRGAKYRDGRDQTPEEKWPGFEANIKKTNPVTFASVLRLSKKKRDQHLVDEFWRDAGIDEDSKEKEFELLNLCDTAGVITPLDWLIEGYIPANSLGMLFGRPGCGKSFVALDMTLHIGVGLDWHGNSTSQGGAIYLAGEGFLGLKQRQQAWLNHYGITDFKIKNRYPFYSNVEPVNIYDEKSAIKITQRIMRIKQETGISPKIIVLDTVATSMPGGDENSTADMTKFIDHIKRYLMIPFKCAVLLIHHAGHQHSDRARGSGVPTAAADYLYLVEGPPMEKGIIRPTFECKKMKDAEPPNKQFFESEIKNLGLHKNEKGELKDVKSLVLRPLENSGVEEISLKGFQKAVFELLKRQPVEDGWIGREEARKECIKQKLVKKGKDFNNVLTKLKEKKLIELTTAGVKIIDDF